MYLYNGGTFRALQRAQNGRAAKDREVSDQLLAVTRENIELRRSLAGLIQLLIDKNVIGRSELEAMVKTVDAKNSTP